MIKSMTGFGRAEAGEKGIRVSIELKSLNGRYLDLNMKLPKNLSHREHEIREILRGGFTRGNVACLINVEYDETDKPNLFNQALAAEYFTALNTLRTGLKIRETPKLEHLLHFSNYFMSKEDDTDDEQVWKLIKKAMKDALRNIDKMRKNEGSQIQKDLQNRMNSIKQIVDKIESLGFEKIPDEREKYRQRIAQLFELDEVDEHRIQMEIVLLADKLDISEECVRLNSHIKFFNEALKDDEQPGRKINFLLQEMHREINTIGSKASDSQISHLVVSVKEELERIREQVQNIE